jgi:iron(III) transport system ATP-binding protein
VSGIEIAGVFKRYGTTEVLRDVHLSVPDGSITAVLGASGSGKTTILKIIAGFERADIGQLRIGEQVVEDGHRSVRPQRRGVGYVPQDAVLFPHLTVAGNVSFGMPRARRARLGELIELVGLTGLDKRYPNQLSGGQQQRVALARALAIEPRVVLLDEPFGSLDAALREEIRAEVVDILVATKTTTILVTHDQDEALSLADNIAVLDHGMITAFGPPRELYEQPVNAEIATAIGIANIVDGERTNGAVTCLLGQVPMLPSAVGAGPCRVLLRPEQVAISTAADAGQLAATVLGARFHGHDTLIDLSVAGSERPLVARIAGPADLRTGQHVWLSANSAVHVWDRAHATS